MSRNGTNGGESTRQESADEDDELHPNIFDNHLSCKVSFSSEWTEESGRDEIGLSKLLKRDLLVTLSLFTTTWN